MSIKLIAADLDGTLLNSARAFSPDLFPLIETLHARGVRFAPASGRQYYNLRDMFAPIADELFYISENGAMVCDGAEIVAFDEMAQADVCAAVELARETEGVRAILACRAGGFYEADDAVFYENALRYYARYTHTPDLLAVAKSEPVCKVALFCAGGAEERLLPVAQAAFAGKTQIALAGADWVDLMRLGMNKGVAVHALCKQFDIAPEDCMAFGDYLNDLEMLEAVGHSYAMANGHEMLKKAAKHVCPSNDEDGVCCTIRAALGL